MEITGAAALALPTSQKAFPERTTPYTAKSIASVAQDAADSLLSIYTKGSSLLRAHLARAPLGHTPVTSKEAPQRVEEARVSVLREEDVLGVVHGAGGGQVLGSVPLGGSFL